MGKRAAKAKMDEVMGTINRADYVIQSQIPFGEMLDSFLRAHAAKLGYAARCKYELLIKNHVRPAFGGLMISELTTPYIQEWLDKKELSWSTKTDSATLIWTHLPANVGPT
jgi:hypothetical protein